MAVWGFLGGGLPACPALPAALGARIIPEPPIPLVWFPVAAAAVPNRPEVSNGVTYSVNNWRELYDDCIRWARGNVGHCSAADGAARMQSFDQWVQACTSQAAAAPAWSRRRKRRSWTLGKR